MLDNLAERAKGWAVSMPGLLLGSISWWDSPYINRFLSADTIVPGYANPQNLNRYSYVTNNPLRYTDPTGHRRCEHDSEFCESEKQVTKKYEENQEKIRERSRKKKETSAVATMATVLDTVAAGLNGVYAITGDIVMLACPYCAPAVLSAYQTYSSIPNIISTFSLGLWFMDGVATGENSISFSQNSVSVSLSQDTLIAAGTNLAGWTILREPNAAFLVDAAVAGYDYARLGAIPFVDYTLPAFINPTLKYNTSTGFDFSWHK